MQPLENISLYYVTKTKDLSPLCNQYLRFFPVCSQYVKFLYNM